MSLGYFFHSDGTWKSRQEMQMILDTVGITPDKTVITYCGGGPLSACMYFTFKYVLDYPDVRNYAGSYLDWITDPRDLPVNLYGNDHWLRDTAWMRWWVGERMQRLMPVSPALAVDVRSLADYESGHIPWSVNIPMDDVDQVVSSSAGAWAGILGDHGVSNGIEIVAVDETVTPATTLFSWLLQYLGHEKVSVACEGLDGWSAARYPVSVDDTVIAEPETPIDVAIHPTTFTTDVRSDIRLSAADAPREYPFSRLWVVAAEEVPEDLPVDSYIHVPWTSNLTEDGLLMPADALWSLYEEAEVQYFNEIICYSDDPAEATMTWFVLRLLNFPRVLVYLPEGRGL
jgi:3-mercaptopyruvate sulfurtransferase SseA